MRPRLDVAPMPSRPRAVLALALATAVGCGPLASPSGDPVEVLERLATEGAGRARESAVALEYSAADAPTGTRRVASGVVINDAGEVLSVRIDRPSSGTSPIVARVASGRRLPATWVASDPESGLTLLRIPPGVAAPAEPSSRPPTPGLPVLLVGNPFGLGHSIGRGQVSGTGRRLLYGSHRLGGLFQVDAGLHPGDSGAPVTDLRGRWLGLIRSGLASPGVEGDRDRDAVRPDRGPGHDLGFAIPAREALWIAGQLRAHGRVERAFLGVVTNPLTSPADAAPASAGSRPEGVELTDVVAGSPASLAGLRPGDRIVALSGEKIAAPLDLNDILDRTAAGDAVTVDFLRPAAAGGPGDRFEALRQTLLTAHRPRSASPGPPPAADAVAEPPPRPGASAAPTDTAEAIARLERRVRELERAEAQRGAGAGVARKP